MSKSLRNFVTIQDVLDKYDANAIRFFILTNHYRMPVDFNDEALQAAKNGVKRLKNAYEDVKVEIGEEKIQEAKDLLSFLFDEIAKTGQIPFHRIDKMQELEEKIPAEIMNDIIIHFKNFIAAMDDDFNTPKALAIMFEMANCAQKARQLQKDESAAFCVGSLVKISEVLGFDLKKAEKAGDEVTAQLMDLIIDIRHMVRKEKNWALSDKIRDRLTAIGITLKDQKDKTTWSFQ